MVHERSTTGNNLRHAMRCASLYMVPRRACSAWQLLLLNFDKCGPVKKHACMRATAHACMRACRTALARRHACGSTRTFTVHMHGLPINGWRSMLSVHKAPALRRWAWALCSLRICRFSDGNIIGQCLDRVTAVLTVAACIHAHMLLKVGGP
jgi:hypothetical protein